MTLAKTKPGVQELLTETEIRLRNEPERVDDCIALLAAELRRQKREQSPACWAQTVDQCRLHSLRELLHQDPLTERAFSKPYGYQGDADLLDIIYRQDWAGIYHKPVSLLGRRIFDYTIACKAPSAVRTRRDMLAGTIERVCERVRRPHILSVACGHLREASLAPSVMAGHVGRFVALDQNAAAIATVNRELGRLGVRAVQGSIKLVLGGPLAEERFDLIYAAGIYDYLEDRFARRLTAKLFNMLKPAGQLLIANFLPDIEDVGYMEIYMDWRLNYRDAAAMEGLTRDIQARIADQRIYSDVTNNIAFLELAITTNA